MKRDGNVNQIIRQQTTNKQLLAGTTCQPLLKLSLNLSPWCNHRWNLCARRSNRRINGVFQKRWHRRTIDFVNIYRHRAIGFLTHNLGRVYIWSYLYILPIIRVFVFAHHLRSVVTTQRRCCCFVVLEFYNCGGVTLLLKILLTRWKRFLRRGIELCKYFPWYQRQKALFSKKGKEQSKEPNFLFLFWHIEISSSSKDFFVESLCFLLRFIHFVLET